MASCKKFGSDHPKTNQFIDDNCGNIEAGVQSLQESIAAFNAAATIVNTAAEPHDELSQFKVDKVSDDYAGVNYETQFNTSFDDLSGLKNTAESALKTQEELDAALADDASVTFTDTAVDNAYLEIKSAKDALVTAATEIKDLSDRFEEITETLAKTLSEEDDARIEAEAAKETRAAMAANTGRQGNQMSSGPAAQKVQAAKEAERIKREQLEKDREGLSNIAALTVNENYLSKPYREQCYVQAQIFELIKLRRDPAMPKQRKLPVSNASSSPVGQACIMAGGTPFGFINKLTQSESIKTMFEIPPEVLSQLQPTVRLYKVIPGEKPGTEEDVEITFDGSTTASDVKEMLANKKRRGRGVGLKSFNWTYDGSDPFSTKKSIKAKLKLHAASFADLLAPRGTGRGKFRYVDLALKTGTTETECRTSAGNIIEDASSKLNFRLKVLVGYAIPKKLAISRGDRNKIQAAIRDSFVTLELTPTIHEFEFDEFGRVNLVINYLAYIEDFFDDFYYDIFAAGEKSAAANFNRRMKQAFSRARKNKEGDQLQPPTEEDPEILKAEQMSNLKSLLSALFENKRLYYYKIPYGSMTESMYGGVRPVYDVDGGIPNRTAVTNEISSLRTQAREAGTAGRTADATATTEKADELETHLGIGTAKGFGADSYEQVTFFYLYDLIDVILNGIEVALRSTYPNALGKLEAPDGAKHIKTKERATLRRMQTNFKNLRVLLGPMEISDPQKPDVYLNVSIGEAPISVSYFTEWMASKVLAKGRTGFTLSAFINQFVKNYLRNFLNDNRCGGDKSRQRVSLYNASVTSYYDGPTDEISELLLKSWRREKVANKRVDVYVPKFTGGALLNTMGSRTNQGPRNKGQESQRNWMIFYAGRSRPQELMRGDYSVDHSHGIFHYVLGSDKGIVKTIKLDRTSATGLKELRFEQEGYDGLMQLREVYNVTVDAFLLPNTFPGTYMYVDPRGFAPNTTGYHYNQNKKKMPLDQYELSRYGIGGYYMIIKTTHTIAEGVRSSQIVAHWVAEVDKNSKSNNGNNASVDSNPDVSVVKKCALKRTEYQASTSDNKEPVPEDEVGYQWNEELGESTPDGDPQDSSPQ